MPISRIALSLLSLAVAGCASFPGNREVAEAGVDGVACVGAVPSAADQLTSASNTALLAKSQYASGKGGMCAAKVFAVAGPVSVYRVYDSQNPHSMYGSWWALARPAGPKDDYRAINAICKAWSGLDRLVSCQARNSSEIVLGTTQSADCPDGTVYPKTAAIQVYMPNDQRAGILHVENCREEGAWP